MKQASPAAPGSFTGRHMAMLAIGFFGVVISVNIGMAVVSQVSWTGLVVDNSYVESQEFETKRLAHLDQVAAGWASALTVSDGILRLVIADAAGKPVDLGTVTALVNRPVGGHDDQQLTLTRAADGSYTAPVTLADGVWDSWLTAPTTSLGFWELHERFKIGSAGK